MQVTLNNIELYGKYVIEITLFGTRFINGIYLLKINQPLTSEHFSFGNDL